jgi:hypothetical protein
MCCDQTNLGAELKAVVPQDLWASHLNHPSPRQSLQFMDLTLGSILEWAVVWIGHVDRTLRLPSSLLRKLTLCELLCVVGYESRQDSISMVQIVKCMIHLALAFDRKVPTPAEVGRIYLAAIVTSCRSDGRE